MNKEEIIEQLTELRNEIKNYAKYLKDETYHPYSEVENFASQLQSIIENIENNE